MGWFGESKEEHKDAKLKEFSQKYQTASTEELKDASIKLQKPPEDLPFGKKALNYMYGLGMSPEGFIAQVAGFALSFSLSNRLKVSEKTAFILGNAVLPAAVAIIPTMRYNNAEYQELVEDQQMEKSFVKKLLEERESAAQHTKHGGKER
jgi:hypothetical protein